MNNQTVNLQELEEMLKKTIGIQKEIIGLMRDYVEKKKLEAQEKSDN